jgi:hypothetical protein
MILRAQQWSKAMNRAPRRSASLAKSPAPVRVGELSCKSQLQNDGEAVHMGTANIKHVYRVEYRNTSSFENTGT